jgi:thymidylate synthase
MNADDYFRAKKISSMRQYHELMQHVLATGATKTDRTGTGTRSVFGYQLRYDLSKGFPLRNSSLLPVSDDFFVFLNFTQFGFFTFSEFLIS